MVPYPYNKPQRDLLYKLINEANPTAPFTMDLSNATIGIPVAQAVVNGKIADTNVLLSGKSAYIGSKRVEYRRIDLSKFFKNITPSFDDYTPGTVVTTAMLVDYFNRTFGLALTVNDFQGGGGTWSPGPAGFAIDPKSLCYSGTISWTWTNGKRQIGSAFTAPNVDGRLWGGGNVFDQNRKPTGQYIAYDLDYSPVKDVMATLASTGTWSFAGSPTFVPLFDFLKSNVSPLFDQSKQHTEVGGLNGATYTKTTMPSATFPEANSLSPKFKNVLVLTPLPTSWWQGRILMHYTP